MSEQDTKTEQQETQTTPEQPTAVDETQKAQLEAEAQDASPSVDQEATPAAEATETTESTETATETADVTETTDAPTQQDDEVSEDAEPVEEEYNARTHFHSEGFDRLWLSRASAYSVSCALLAEQYVLENKTDDPVAEARLDAYRNLKTEDGVVNVLTLASRLVGLYERYLGESFVRATLHGRGFYKYNKQDRNELLEFTERESRTRLDRASSKELVKALRFTVEEGCARMFHPKTSMDDWVAEEATYRESRSSPHRTSLSFAEFAGQFLKVHWQLYKLSESLHEVDTALVPVNKALEKDRQRKRLERYEQRKKKEAEEAEKKKQAELERRRNSHVSSNPRVLVAKRTAGKPLPPPPKNPWGANNPVSPPKKENSRISLLVEKDLKQTQAEQKRRDDYLKRKGQKGPRQRKKQTKPQQKKAASKEEDPKAAQQRRRERHARARKQATKDSDASAAKSTGDKSSKESGPKQTKQSKQSKQAKQTAQDPVREKQLAKKFRAKDKSKKGNDVRNKRRNHFRNQQERPPLR